MAPGGAGDPPVVIEAERIEGTLGAGFDAGFGGEGEADGVRVRIGEGSELDTGQAGQHGGMQPPEAAQTGQADPQRRGRGREPRSG